MTGVQTCALPISMALSSRDISKQRASRVRRRLRSVAKGRPRLSVFRSSKNIYAQIIDDKLGVTLAAASSLEAGTGVAGADKDAAAKVGTLVAQRARSKRALRTWSSTAVVIFFMGASRRSRKRPAKPS